MNTEIVLYAWTGAIKRRLFEAVQKGLRNSKFVTEPSNNADLEIMWGTGHPTIIKRFEAARERSSYVLAFDLGYWNREGTNPSFRFSINAPHPQALVMKYKRDSTRWEESAFKLRHDYFNEDGPIILIGMGAKSAETYNEQVGDWERKTYELIKQQFPKKHLIWRPKPNGRNNKPFNTPVATDLRPSIFGPLMGASLIICRGSNVAVDACRVGIPVVCEDGAGAAIYPSQLSNFENQPTLETRKVFLGNLAWFQYTETELTKAETWGIILPLMRGEKPL